MNRRKNNEKFVETWNEMKAIMRRRFVPKNIYKDLYQKLQSVIQHSKSVNDYYKEVEIVFDMGQYMGG